MTFLYFAYGSNLWPPQMCGRCASARPIGSGVIHGWRLAYDKPGGDGTAKANLREEPGSEVHGVVYELDSSDREELDRAEPGYTSFDLEVRLDDDRAVEALTYRYEPDGTSSLPADWYVSLVTSGASHHGLATSYVDSHLKVEAGAEPGVPGMRPASAEDLPAMQSILSSALSAGTERYSIHPGDLAWWMWHEDPRQADRVSYWIVPQEVLLVIDAAGSEIDVFASSERDRAPYIEWAQRRLRGKGQVAGVADSDLGLIDYLKSNGYQPGHVNRWYHWDLGRVEVPEPELPDGWELRHVAGEHEAGERRRASHAAFRSTMDPEMHLQRYLRFMRSPVYDPSRDLVAVSPDGQIASFMIWWPDQSGIAQIEPFGTHPDFQRRGVGKALIHHGLRRMRDSGMTLCRVITDEPRTDATAFYESVGFQDVGRLRWWQRP
jgi:gamma-glutamylcyclotransferase